MYTFIYTQEYIFVYILRGIVITFIPVYNKCFELAIESSFSVVTLNAAKDQLGRCTLRITSGKVIPSFLLVEDGTAVSDEGSAVDVGEAMEVDRVSPVQDLLE